MTVVWKWLGVMGVVVLVIFLLMPVEYESVKEPAPRADELSTQHDMTYMPHYVKIHIVPEREGIKVTAIPEGQDVVLTGSTDSNSDVMFEMISALKYNLTVGSNSPPCQYYIIPSDSEYLIECNGGYVV